MLVIAILLVFIAGLLGFESAVGDDIGGALIESPTWRPVVGIGAGIVIGLVSSLFGVAGGKLIIPTLLFVFGLDIRTAGTASLSISIPTVLVGVLRHHRGGAYRSRTTLVTLVLPMACGSMLGAVVGAMLLPFFVPADIKAVLAIILVLSVYKLARKAT